MTITQLHYVLAVAEHKNFTLAASHCYVTQPTLSMQIQKLEDELEVLLFNRAKKPIQLTPIGEKIVRQARIIVDESNRINDIVDQQKGFIGGEFKLAIIPSIMPTLLPLFLKSFTKKYHKVKLKIQELTTEEIIKKLNDGHLDAGIAATPLELETIVERPLYYEPFVGLINRDHRLFSKDKLKPEDLKASDMLLLEEGNCFKDSVLNICSSDIKAEERPFSLDSGSFDTLIQLTKEGLGMTLLPYLQSIELSEKDQELMRNFESPAPAREVSLIYHKSQLKLQLIEALKDRIDGIIRGVIQFNEVEIISPLKKK
jgi:LysR family hydrogen peroxide-inducible transcriptional activator